MEAKDLLLHDLEYIRSSFRKNEEIGEKRFSFFLTLVTAAAAALVGLSSVVEAGVTDIVTWALTILLIFGLLTYARMLHRNAVSDHYKNLADYVWKMSLDLCGELRDRSYGLDWKPKSGVSKWLRGGYAEAIGAINGLVLTLLLYNLGGPVSVAIAIGVVLAVASWLPSVHRK